jgi:hypothetical protein
MHALLELDCMPAGMELFPAANEDQWSLIKKVIDECDYYIVISAGRYGSLGPEGLSYTEMEYRYAIEAGKPVIAFLHKDPLQLPAARFEQTDEGRTRLNAFREVLQKKVCKYWDTPAELGSVASRSLIRLTKTAPGVGWIRADEATDALAAAEVLRLRNRIEELEGRLREARSSAPPESEKLAQGADVYSVEFKFDTTDKKGQNWVWRKYTVDIAWDDIFYDVGPLMINEATDYQIRRALNETVSQRSEGKRAQDENLKDHQRQRSFEISDHDFQTIKVQLRALGLIAKSQKPRSIKDTDTYWTLTPYGDQVLTTLRAIPRAVGSGNAAEAAGGNKEGD